MWLQLLLVLLAVLFALHCYIRKSRIGYYVEKMPGPPAYPLIGNLLSFMVPFGTVYSSVWYSSYINRENEFQTISTQTLKIRVIRKVNSNLAYAITAFFTDYLIHELAKSRRLILQ